ncbi:sialate O-acetylesterase [Mucilaginibacter sp. UR6-1]|uniref:sialate O-acetylesterase n=1 Tax=Mucilaginibacter sp. UR6-1 TaxID=1435643 RepID=UPI001E4C8B9D|nr:sialate O-acetylesterase [Mucilaginibacter sp. UR6-1]MCC8408256.1 sialate O-acetylesterase [Mucilaginibacter sp. UR6-1]
MINSFLMVGQSNMAGRGYLKDVKQIYDEHIKMLINGRWQTMTEPINFDRPTAGIGLAASFAGAWRLKNENGQIGLIPCADGGSSLDDWEVGGALFENAVFQAKAAQRMSTLSGILWHQGENDSFVGRSAVYYDKLDVIVDAFRRELGVPDIPFIAGGLGDFLTRGRYGQYFTEYNAVNQSLQKFAETRPNAYFVTAAGLKANQDDLHFDAVSQRKFGTRYFEAFFEKRSVMIPPDNENELVNIIQDRALTPKEQTALLEISFAAGKISLSDLEGELALINIK